MADMVQFHLLTTPRCSDMKRVGQPKYRRRVEGVKPERRNVWIVCEGKKTELRYFNSLKSQEDIRKANVDVKAVHGDCTNPMNIVNHAIDNLALWGVDFGHGDGVWCVFDVDTREDQELQDSHSRAEANQINVALSNPCIELWFLIHFEDQRAGLERDQAASRYRVYQPGYDKEVDPKLLKPHLPLAIDRAKFLNEMHNRAGRSFLNTEGNPSSQVFRIFEFIQELVEKNSNET